MKNKYYIIYKFYNGVGCYTIHKKSLFGLFHTLIQKCESEAEAKTKLNQLENAK